MSCLVIIISTQYNSFDEVRGWTISKGFKNAESSTLHLCLKNTTTRANSCYCCYLFRTHIAFLKSMHWEHARSSSWVSNAEVDRCAWPVTTFITNTPSLADRRCRELQWRRMMMFKICVISCLVRSANVLCVSFRLNTIDGTRSERQRALSNWSMTSADGQGIKTYSSKPVSAYTCSHRHTECNCRLPSLTGYSTPSLPAQYPVKWVS